MIIKFKSDINPLSNIEMGNQLFLIGIFFLPSIFILGSILLFGGLIISLKKNINIFSKDKLNYPLILSIGIIIFSAVNITVFNNPYSLSNFNTQIIWFNLLKWLILIISFIGFQKYLLTNNQRVLFAKSFIAGTVPVVLSCLLQKLFLNNGPYQILNGLVIWFQKPFAMTGGVTGLFSNVNYTGIWLALCLPFCICLSRLEKKSNSKNFLILFIFFISYFIFETNSRNAYLGFFIGVSFLIRFRYSIIFIFTQFFLFFFSFFALNANKYLQMYSHLISKGLNLKNDRGFIFKEAISLIKDRPIFGWGASTFNFTFNNRNIDNIEILKIDPHHTHNMALELAYNFGIPLSIIIVSFVMCLIFKSILKIYKLRFKFKYSQEEYLINKAWIISTIIIFLALLNDISFYEDRIGLIICILFSGLRCFIKDNRYSLNEVK